MIKLALVIPTLDQSGAEKQLTLLATRLPAHEFDVQVVALTRCGPYAAALKQHGIPLTVIGKRWKFDAAAMWKLRRWLANWQPDIVHSWLFTANAYVRLVAGGSRRPEVVVSERCVDTWKSNWQLWLDRRLIAGTARLVANSQGVADFYRQVGFPDDRITVIPNGVELPAVDRRCRDEILAEFQIPPGARLVGFAGRLARQKRVKDLIWAMQLLRQLRENVYFLIVGDGPERERLERFARQMTCEHVVRFAGHRDDASQLIGMMDVFWLASDFEGMSNSVMEAMAAGVPAVVSDIPPNRELVVDGETGFVVKVGDSVGFAQFADRILADPKLAQQLGQNAQCRMRSQFSIEEMVASHMQLYREVARGRKCETARSKEELE